MGKERFIHKLTRQDINRLKEFDKEIGKPRVHDRVRAILLSQKGYNINEISRILEMTSDHISKWFNRYEREGAEGLIDRPRSGRPAKVTQRHISLVLQAIEKSPRLYGYERSTWSCALLAKYIEQKTKTIISDDCVRILLHKFGFRSGRGKLRIVSPDPLYDKKNAIWSG